MIAEPSPLSKAEAIEGCLLGTAAGDMFGLPFENLSRTHVARLLRLPLEQSMFLGRGLVSDDTEHTFMLARSVLESPRDPERFLRRFATRLRWWLLSGPPGVGGATARGILKLWMGFSPTRSGVRSAGNGAAMRSALLGVLYGDEPARLVAWVRASVEITHRDERALAGARAVACAAACACECAQRTPVQALDRLVARIAEACGDEPDPLLPLITAMREPLAIRLEVDAYAASLGCEGGVSGFVMHTVPASIYAALRHGDDFRAAVTAVVRCGGDTDSVAAITGAIVGAGLGPGAIPARWLTSTLEWGDLRAQARRLATALAHATRTGQPSAPGAHAWLEAIGWPARLLRNVSMFVLLVGVLVRRTVLLAVRR